MLSRSRQISLVLAAYLRIWFDGCCCGKCKYWLCAAVHSLWNGNHNDPTRNSELCGIYWNCIKFTFVGFFSRYHWEKTSFAHFYGRKLYLCYFICILVQYNHTDYYKVICWIFVSSLARIVNDLLEKKMV